MLSLFCRCVSCKAGMDLSTDQNSFPLCLICYQSLVTCPQLCRHCGSPLCPEYAKDRCRRPWIHRPEIHSYSSRYLLLNPGYTVLRRWKIHQGLLFDRRVLNPNTELISTWKEFGADTVIPIPQLYLRAWKMGGSRAERIARWVATLLQLPVSRILTQPPRSSSEKRQAELKLAERLQSPLRFSIHPQGCGNARRVILVDDFMTSGRTLEKAASTLKRAGIEQVHIFCLGVRVFRFDSERSSHLMKSPGRPIAIGQK